MKNYDDLQRFKDKTRTGAIEFKDMSAQNLQLNNSPWAIIQQLSGDNEDSALAQGGSVAVPVPQAVKPGEFDTDFAKHAPVQTMAPSTAQHSILGSLSAAIPVESAGHFPQAEISTSAVSLFDQLAPVEAPVAKPVSAPVQTAAPVAHNISPVQAEPVRFEQLFAARGSNTANHPAKDLPLQPLLEMIASCR